MTRHQPCYLSPTIYKLFFRPKGIESIHSSPHHPLSTHCITQEHPDFLPPQLHIRTKNKPNPHSSMGRYDMIWMKPPLPRPGRPSKSIHSSQSAIPHATAAGRAVYKLPLARSLVPSDPTTATKATTANKRTKPPFPPSSFHHKFTGALVNQLISVKSKSNPNNTA